MHSWADYLAIEQAKDAIINPTEDSNADLFSLMLALKFSNGVKKYPVFVNLRESLGALLDWRKSNFLQTAFRNRQILKTLAESRKAPDENTPGIALAQTTPKLKQDQKNQLEKEFLSDYQGDLPLPLPDPPFSEASTETPESDLIDLEMAPQADEQPVPEKAHKRRRPNFQTRHQKVDSEDETSPEDENAETPAESSKSGPDPESASPSDELSGSDPSRPFILANTQSLTEFVAHEGKNAQQKFLLNPMEQVRFAPQYSSFHQERIPSSVQLVAPKQLAAATDDPDQEMEELIQEIEGLAPSSETAKTGGAEKPSRKTSIQKPSAEEKSEPEIEVPELETTPDLPEDPRACAPDSVSGVEGLQNFLSDSIPEADSENVKSEKPERAPAKTSLLKKDASRPAPLKPFTNKIPALPVLHYSLKETVGNAPAAPKYEGQETIDQLQKKLVGDFSKDLKTVRQCWLLEEFQVPSDEDLAAAYENIQNAFNHFSETLYRLNETKRQGWIQRLHLETLNLYGDPQLDVLQDVYRQLSNGNVGLELSVFVNLRETIKHYLALVSIKNDPEQGGKMFTQARNRVVKLLEIVEKDHSSVIERALEDELNWLEMAGQAEISAQATRRMWTKPNLIGQVGASIFERYGTRAVQEEEKITNQIQRASIYGTSNFNGNLVMKPVPNPDRIELEVVLAGSSDSRTRAYAGPAIILSRAKSRIQAEKKIYFDQSGFSTNNAKVDIRTNSQIQNVQDIWNRPFVENFVLRRAYARKDQTESAATAQSSARLRARFNKQVDDAIRSWNAQMSELARVHFRMRDLELQNTRTWSDEAGAHGQTLFTCRAGMGAYSAPPQVPEATDLQFAVHETALQNAFAGFLGGLNLDAYARKHLMETAPAPIAKALQNAESKEKEDENSRDEDWAMHFPKDWPVSISMQDGKLECVIHCSGIEANKKSYPAVNILVSYTIEVHEDGIYFVREGEIEILPPDYDPDSNARLPASMVSLRRVMGKRLQEALPPEIVLKEQPIMKNPPADSLFAKVQIKPVFVQAKDGWLQVGMNLFEKE
ncbi:MAG: hypothetical protein K6C40_08255 [Thermoguttaceae bacterium]|nr:hypothetical protein [Thermoguttaceae bacterium]